MKNSPDLGRETAVISKLLAALSQNVLKPFFPLIWWLWLLKQLLSLLPVLLESSAAPLRNREKKPNSNFILRSSEIALVDGSYFCSKNVFITLLPLEGMAIWPVLLPEMLVQHSWWAEPMHHCQHGPQLWAQEICCRKRGEIQSLCHILLLVRPCRAFQRIPDGASWEGDFAMRAALHGLAIYINNALTQPICVSCYSYSGSDLSLVQAHQTQRSCNTVDLAWSHSSLATEMKRHSRASILLHKNDREA